jgi:hypothetical protein
MWLGRYKLGDTLRVPLLADNTTAPSTPAAAPTLAIYTANGVKVFAGGMPPLDPYAAVGLFSLAVRLGELFAVGQYRVVMQYQVSGGARQKVAHFAIVDGGNAGGNFIAGTYYQRPQAAFLVLRTDADTRVLARNPFE